jgi:hypothetical protein
LLGVFYVFLNKLAKSVEIPSGARGRISAKMLKSRDFKLKTGVFSLKLHIYTKFLPQAPDEIWGQKVPIFKIIQF